MNEKQLQIVENFGLGQSVIAGAGCGKTTTLVAKCVKLLERNPKARFCAVSFTEKSVKDLKESLTEKLSHTGSLDQAHWVKTIHGLCYSILQEFPVSAKLQGGEKILLEDEAGKLWEDSIRVLWLSRENLEISKSVERLLDVFSRDQLEQHFRKLRSLMSFGVSERIPDEMHDLWTVFQSVYDRYTTAKSKAGGLDFNDLELLAFRALQDDEVSRHYQDRFDLVMVDEFQDTNPLQASILRRFVKSNFSNLCIVGDPKQSIYRFRDADVTVFEELTKELPKKHLLDTNYRSRPAIIQFVNEVCAPAFTASGLNYEALEAGRNEDEELSQLRVSRLVIEDEKDLAHFLKSEEQRGVDLSEFVILARSIRQEKTLKFLKELSLAHVPYLLGSGGQFYSDVRVQELVAFLKGWLSPGNTLSQVAALRAPWIGMTDPWLYEKSKLQAGSYFDYFFQESTHPIALALKEIYLDPERKVMTRPGEVLRLILKVPSLLRELHLPIVSLWHRAEDMSSHGRRFDEIVQAFSDAIENDKIEKEIPPAAERGMVRVLTVHGSKGLQFPRVILLDFDGEYKSRGASPDIIWDRKAGIHLYKRDEDGKRDHEDLVNLKFAEIEKAAQIAESKRVFYVALTRAQEELILVWKKEVKKSSASEKPDFDPYLTDHWRAWVEKTRLPEEKIWKTHEPSQMSLFPSETPETLEKSGANEVLLTEHVLITAENFDPKPYQPRFSPSEWLALDDERIVFDGESTPAREKTKNETAELGIRLHSLLETENFETLQDEFGVDARPLFQDLSEGTEVFKELAFEVPLTRVQALAGIMDRLEVNSTAKSIRVIDYKFTANPRSKEALLEKYQLQLKLYIWAAAKLVDFVPEKLEAELLHFTRSQTAVRVPLEISPENVVKTLAEIEAEVQYLFERARAKT